MGGTCRQGRQLAGRAYVKELGRLSIYWRERTKAKEERKMADGHEGTALAVAPIQGEIVKPWENLKPLSYETARMLTRAECYDRFKEIGRFTTFFDGIVRQTILAYITGQS
jgi:hypothetical protein